MSTTGTVTVTCRCAPGDARGDETVVHRPRRLRDLLLRRHVLA
ncbi:hypothetical protein [Streptomyces daliensis]